MESVRVISRWCNLLDGLSYSPQAFYESLDAALLRRQIPEATTARVEHTEGGVLTAKREYLRVSRKGYTFDICAAPFGSGFFVSWWFAKVAAHGLLHAFAAVVASFIAFGLLMKVAGVFLGFFLALILIPGAFLAIGYGVRQGVLGIEEETLLEIPVFGFLYAWIFRPFSYYRLDTERMFEAAVHAAVLEVIDELSKAKGIRALSELERKPILREFSGRGR